MRGRELPRDFGARHARHHQIGEQQFRGVVERGRERDRLFAVRGFVDLVAVPPQHRSRQRAHGRFVFDNQNALRSDGGHDRGVLVRRSAARVHRRRREEDAEGRALGRFAGDPDEPVELLDDAVDGGESEPGPAPHFLRGEERFEDVRAHVGRHAGAGVAHLERHVVARRHRKVSRRERRVRVEVAGDDAEFAAVGHGIAGVGGEIDQDLLELRRVRDDQPQPGVQRRLDPNVFADGAFEQAAQILDDGVDVDRGGPQHLAAAEGEQLAGQGGGALAGFFDLLEVRVDRLVRADLVEQHLAVAGDRRQDVIEVVGDSARETADRLHLLGLAELIFETLPHRDVLGERLELARVGKIARGETDGDETAVLPAPFDLFIGHVPGADDPIGEAFADAGRAI